MILRVLRSFTFAICSVVLGLASCGPLLQGGGFTTGNTMAGFGNWSGNGVGFGVYTRGGGVLGGTGICLYQDMNGDGKLTCNEVSGCVEKTSGGPEKYIVGGSTAGSGAVPPRGFICGKVNVRDANGTDHSYCVGAQTQVDSPIDVCGLKDCCPCVKCGVGSGSSDQDGSGHAARDPFASTPAALPPTLPWYEWRDGSDQLQMRVTHDAAGTNWTILAGASISATSIEVIQIDAAGQVLQRQPLTTTTTSEGLSATWSGTPRNDQFTVFSARATNRPLVNFFVNANVRGTQSEKAYIESVFNATFQ
jgi:hypothetical protein